MIPLTECEHGWLYRIRSRNLGYGVFRQDVDGFVGIREKFGSRYLFTEYHYDTGSPFGTVTPLEKLIECPVSELNGTLGTECGVCKKPASTVPNPDGDPNHVLWVHADGSPSADCAGSGGHVPAWAISNKELFDWLVLEERNDLYSRVYELDNLRLDLLQDLRVVATSPVCHPHNASFIRGVLAKYGDDA